jgi:glucose/mannose transport system substrate-binding protein
LNSWGLVTDGTFGCTAVPGTANLHLYDIDTLAMFTTEHSRLAAQHKLAQIVMSEKVQNNYNQVKGSIPVLRKASLSNMDSCSRVSWKVFSRGKSAQVPSFTHRMATDETSRDTLITELHRYFMDDQITTLEEQSRFVSISRILTKIGSAK